MDIPYETSDTTTSNLVVPIRLGEMSDKEFRSLILYFLIGPLVEVFVTPGRQRTLPGPNGDGRGPVRSVTGVVLDDGR